MSRLQEKFGSDDWEADHGWDRRSVILLLGLFALAILVGLFVAKARSPSPALTSDVVAPALPVSALPSEKAAPTTSEPVEPEPVASDIVVEVVGKVRDPGVYTLAAGSRVHDLLERAGGVRSRVDTSDTNLARVLVDGEQIRIGLALPGVPDSATPGIEPNPTPSGLVNINTADAAALQQLPGIGPVLAQRIVTYREQNGAFTSKEQLMEVSGIGDATFADVAAAVTL